MRSRETVSVGLLVFALAVVSVGWAPAAAQLPGQDQVTEPEESYLLSTHLSVGYVINAPDQLVGFSASTAGPMWSGWGLYADFKFSVANPDGEDNYVEDRTATEAEQLGDQRFGQPESAWNTVNVALVRAVAHEVALYAGGGYSQETVYREYFDDQQNRGEQGFYTVEDEREGGDVLNLMGGVLFRTSKHLIFQIGGETAPAGFTAGAAVAFPLGR